LPQLHHILHFNNAELSKIGFAWGNFLFTQVTFERSPFLCDEVARTILHNVIEQCQNLWLFELEAIVLLPDHHHGMWSLPENDSDYSRRWGWLKKTFTQRWLAEGGRESSISEGKLRDGRRGVWQPKFWEHMIRDDDDFNEHSTTSLQPGETRTRKMPTSLAVLVIPQMGQAWHVRRRLAMHLRRQCSDSSQIPHITCK